MLRTIRRLWGEDDGAVLSSEILLYGTVGVVGATAGYATLRDAVNSELDDVAKAIGSMDQTYWYSGVQGHGAYTAGSAYFDRADLCDIPPLQPYVEVCPPPGRPLVCADVFGPQARPAADVVPGPDRRPAPPPERPRSGGDERREPSRDEPRPVLPGASKGVRIGDPHPTVVVGAPGLAPAHGPAHGPAIGIHVDPRVNGPYLVDVPEGYFNRPPTGYIGPMAQYHMLVNSRFGGPADYGYRYMPADVTLSGQVPVITNPAGPPIAVPAPGPHPIPGHGTPAHWNTIDLGFAKVGDDELKNVEKFKDAKCLHVLGSNVTDRGLEYVAELEQLESLHLVGTQITDAGLKRLQELPRLRFLHLVGTRITDAGLVHLRGLKHLEELDVRGTLVSDRGLAELQHALPTLKVVR